MKASYSNYNYEESDSRINEILNSSDYGYQEKDHIPARENLTFTNGYYVKCSAMFIDMRSSKTLSQKYRRPTLARIYRVFISELVALLRGNSRVREISIEGDCVWGIFDTRQQCDVNELFATAGGVISLQNIINWRFAKRHIDPIAIGVGLDYGRALMIKGGYRGSGINEVVWMGDVVGSAATLCSFGARSFIDYPVMLSDIVYTNLSDDNKILCSWSHLRSCYQANIIDIEMDEWLNKQQ